MQRGFIRNLLLLLAWFTYPPFVLFGYVVAWTDRKIRFPLPFPRDLDELAKKEQWCLRVLRESGALPAEAEVRSYKVIPFTQAHIFRSNSGIIEIDYSSRGGRQALRCFVKCAPTMGSVWNRTVFNLQMNHIKEVWFNRYFVRTDEGVPAPKVYCAKMALLTGNMCLITEMMDDGVEYKQGASDDFPLRHLEMVVEGLARLHALYWKKKLKRRFRVLPIFDNTVDFFESMVAKQWSLPARKILVQSWLLMNEHETVLHGDARIGNMLFPSNDGKGRFVFIDWQAVRKGKAAFDLAYFLILSLPPTFRIFNEKQAIDTYYKMLIASGVSDYSREEMDEDYRHACLCVLVLLALPMLSGEASVEGDAALIFAYGMTAWREVLKIKFSEFDYQWLASHYRITESEGREAVAEMLKGIEDRLDLIFKKTGKVYLTEQPTS